MARYIGGDIVELICKHPDLGDFRYAPKGSENFSYDPGGIRTNDDATAITGDGQAITTKNNMRWAIDATCGADLSSDNELSSLTALAASPVPGIWTSTHISGDIRKGSGWPVGDIVVDTDKGTIKFKLGGGGKLEKIA